MKKLVFWYDFASTYSYLSVMRIGPICAQEGVEVIWRPFLLGAIFKVQGLPTSPFKVYPAKGRYMWRDMKRLTENAQLPYEWPDAYLDNDEFPRRSILAARVALTFEESSKCESFTKRVFVAEFGKGLDISKPKIISEILEDMGFNAEDILQSSEEPEIKQKLRENTDMAIKLDLFGAPSFTINKELFWGNDRLEAALAHAKTAEEAHLREMVVGTSI